MSQAATIPQPFGAGGQLLRPQRAPWDPPGELSAATWAEVEREALRVNDRYLHELIENYAFCPFAKDGRRNGATARYVLRAGSDDVTALLDLFAHVAAQQAHAVTQVIVPLVDVGPAEFSAFCNQLTAIGNALQPAPVLACAPLHPTLPFLDVNPYALVPLFRRAPDPTIQWVRLDGLEAIYAGRTSGTTCPTPDELEALLRDGPKKEPRLYDRVAETNQKMARRLGIPRLVELFAEQSDDARRSYQRVLLAAEAPELH